MDIVTCLSSQVWSAPLDEAYKTGWHRLQQFCDSELRKWFKTLKQWCLPLYNDWLIGGCSRRTYTGDFILIECGKSSANSIDERWHYLVLGEYRTLTYARERTLYLIISFIWSQWRDSRIEVRWWNIWVLVTAPVAELRTSWRRFIAGRLSRRELQ